jgi:eukaryotic-like serine/threonine-protein kinase
VLEKITNYKIIKKLGEGGMGEVYLAEDERLNRKVALKVLPSEIVKDRKNLNRFFQEARLAANLNHPNICTIYEVGETVETPFLAMELIEGKTLAEKLQDQKPEVEEVLRIVSQIADALDEAHQKGVIHRDIKASNIIINQREQVKVLDFGLAKIITEEVSDQDITRAKTEEGMLVGTVQYMSPEQALGKKLDGRTDLWSLGVLFYEMICGQVPFKAVTHAGVFDEILHKEPGLPSKLNEHITTEFETIILKLLEKDRDLRYQTASDLRADLKRLRRSLGESFASSETVMLPSIELRKSQAAKTKSKTSRLVLFGIAALLILSGISFAAYKFFLKPSANFSLADANTVRLTNLGKVTDANVSGDGKYVAYVTDEGGRQSLWVKQIANGGNVQIIPFSDVVFQGVRVSPDGNWIYYNVWDKKTVGEIFRVPVLGGIPQKVVRDCMPNLTISPDSKRLVFIRSDDKIKTLILNSIAVDGTDEKVLYQTSPGSGAIFSPVFAPDGKTFAVTGYFPDSNGEFRPQIVEFSSEGGNYKPIWVGENQNMGFASSPIWLPNKSGLLVSLASGEIYNQLWAINYADGTRIPVKNDFNSYDSLSITNDGKSVVGVQREFLVSVWTFQINNPNDAKRVTEGKIEGVGVDWTPDNKLVYSSNVNGSFNIWTMNADGTEKRQITNDSVTNINPCVSADGKTILFFATNKGFRKVGFNGNAPTDFSLQLFNSSGGCMRSENSFLFTDFSDKTHAVSTFNFDSGEKKAILEVDAQQAEISPDGKQLAYVYWDENERTLKSEIIDLQTKLKKSLTFPRTSIRDANTSHYNFHWSTDSKSIVYVDNQNGVSNLWLYPMNGEKTKQITFFKDNLIQDFSISRDGKQIAVTRGLALSDVVMFKNEN